MPNATVKVPFRGDLAMGPDGLEVTNEIEPVDLSIIIADGLPWAENRPYWETIAHDYDFETGTVEVDIHCDDEAYLKAIVDFLSSQVDLRLLEASCKERDERARVTRERAGGSLDEAGSVKTSVNVSAEDEERRVARAGAASAKRPKATPEAIKYLRSVPYRGDRPVLQ